MRGSESIKHYIDSFAAGVDLPERETERFLDAVISETDENLLTDLLLAWRKKGYDDRELYGLAKTMRQRCVPVRATMEVFVDAVGTGGSRAKTFNVSTAAAFVVAGAGMPIAKHGNRAATSSSGSADVLDALGVNAAVDAATAERCLDQIGICFMYAPNFHRLSPILGKVRRELGFPSIFNNLGPLCNPAAAPHQLIGVWDGTRVTPTAKALARLGTTRSWVVHGMDGLDEITLSGPTHVASVGGEEVSEFQIMPEDFGIDSQQIDHLAAVSPAESARFVCGVLDRSVDGAARDLVLVNAAAALFISGAADTLPDSFALARESIMSGAALEKLRQLSKETNR